MSFPKMDNSVKTAIQDLKEIVDRQHSDNQEVVDLVSDIETIIANIEIKAGKLAKTSEVVNVTPVSRDTAINVTNSGIIPAV